MTARYGQWKRHPCRQDCPQRRAGCHAECQAYRDYEADKRRRYEAAERARQAYEPTAAAERRTAENQKKEQERRPEIWTRKMS